MTQWAKVANNIKTLTERGVQAFNASKFEEAIAIFTQVLEINPDDTLILSNRAIALRQIGEFDRAILDIDRAIALDPSNAFYYATKAAILTKFHRQLDALEELDKAIDLEPLLEYVLNKVFILKKLNRFQDALSAIEEIESQNHGSQELKLYKGIILFDIGKNGEALQIFRTVSDPQFETIVKHYISELSKSQN